MKLMIQEPNLQNMRLKHLAHDVRNIPIERLMPGSCQPRTYFDEEALSQLAQSILQFGIIQPLIVRPVSEHKFEIIAGERRWRASKIAGLKEVPCLVRQDEHENSLELALIENIQRQDLTPIEEALALSELVDSHHYTHDELSSRLGKPRTSITNTLRLLQLPDIIRNYVHTQQISSGHAKAILTLESESAKIHLAEIIIQKSLSVRKAEDLAKLMQKATSNSQVTRGHPQALSPNLRHLCDQYKGHLGTKVKISGDTERGRIEISYYSQEDLDRITELVLGEVSI